MISWYAKKALLSGNTEAIWVEHGAATQNGIYLLTHLPPLFTINLRHFLQPKMGFIRPKTVMVLSAKQVGQLHA
jgi:hypothetical protein